MKGYEFLPEAEEEMNEAAGFYERRRERLGLEFLNEVQRTITSILAHPQSGPSVSPNIRRRIVRRFPFGVLYAIHEKASWSLQSRISKDVPVIGKRELERTYNERLEWTWPLPSATEVL